MDEKETVPILNCTPKVKQKLLGCSSILSQPYFNEESALYLSCFIFSGQYSLWFPFDD